MKNSFDLDRSLTAKSQGGTHRNINLTITFFHETLELTENAYGCYISRVGWSTTSCMVRKKINRSPGDADV